MSLRRLKHLKDFSEVPPPACARARGRAHARIAREKSFRCFSSPFSATIREDQP